MNTPDRGFSLIEMLISVAIFALIMVAVAAAYLNLINLDRQTRATSVLLTNLSFTIDSMARSIRTGSNYLCGTNAYQPNVNTTCNYIQFTDSNGCRVKYVLNPYGGHAGYYYIREDVANQAGSIGCQVETNLQVTDPRIVVKSMSFVLSGTVAHDTLQPTVLFTVNGSTVVDSTHSTMFTIQTSATQRSIDI